MWNKGEHLCLPWYKFMNYLYISKDHMLCEIYEHQIKLKLILTNNDNSYFNLTSNLAI